MCSIRNQQANSSSAATILRLRQYRRILLDSSIIGITDVHHVSIPTFQPVQDLNHEHSTGENHT